jgi:hypothetical protein
MPARTAGPGGSASWETAEQFAARRAAWLAGFQRQRESVARHFERMVVRAETYSPSPRRGRGVDGNDEHESRL